MVKSIFNDLNKHIEVSCETFDRLYTYCNLLIKWQSHINLVSKTTVSNIWNRHFLDSLQLIPHLPSLNMKMIDIGSGAGFPGMVLAIMGASNINLIESDSKKITFLKEVARLTNTKINIHHIRMEDIGSEKYDVIISRACSDLNQLINLSIKNVSRETISLFHKGKNYAIELEGAKKQWLFDQEILPSITDPNGVIVKLSNIQRRVL